MDKKQEKIKNEADKIVEKHRKVLAKIGQTLETLHKSLVTLSEETDNNCLLISMILMVIHATIGSMPIDQQKTLLDNYLSLEIAAAQCETPESVLKMVREMASREEDISRLYV